PAIICHRAHRVLIERPPVIPSCKYIAVRMLVGKPHSTERFDVCSLGFALQLAWEDRWAKRVCRLLSSGHMTRTALLSLLAAASIACSAACCKAATPATSTTTTPAAAPASSATS